MSEGDILQRFLFEHAPVRGELARLDESWRRMLDGRDYPPAVQRILGQLAVAAVLLSATLKFDGRMILQVQGGGPVGLMVVECRTRPSSRGRRHTLRGMARCGETVADGRLADLFGTDGRLAITLEPDGGEQRYQGIVGLTGAALADALGDYFLRSEQLDTRLWLAADGERAAGMLLQRLPAGPEADADTWNRALRLGDTLRDDELLALPPGEIVHRLYHQEDVRLFETETVAFACTCSRERVGAMLRSLGADEVRRSLAGQGEIVITCEFCRRRHVFDAVDVERVLATEDDALPGSGARH